MDHVWRESPAGSPGSSDGEEEDDEDIRTWAQGISLFIFDEGARKADDEQDQRWTDFIDDVIGSWEDVGAKIVHVSTTCNDKYKRMHQGRVFLVINYLRTGVAERDRRASEDVRWAQDNGIGKPELSSGATCCFGLGADYHGIYLLVVYRAQHASQWSGCAHAQARDASRTWMIVSARCQPMRTRRIKKRCVSTHHTHTTRTPTEAHTYQHTSPTMLMYPHPHPHGRRAQGKRQPTRIKQRRDTRLGARGRMESAMMGSRRWRRGKRQLTRIQGR